MKKLVIIIFSICFSNLSYGQVRLGLKFSPNIVNSRVEQFSDTLDVTDGGKGLKFSMGLVVDKALTDTYYFSTGLIYLPKTLAISVAGENGGSYINPEEEYNLQYLQVPVSLKLFTNDIQPDLAVYFQVGMTAEIKIQDEPDLEEYIMVEEFRTFDSSVLLGAGVEFKAGVSTSLFGGFSYNRGLINAVKTTIPLDDELVVRNTAFTIDFGIKF